jgi:ribosome-binding protein aMBF1 (putative translation factor)
MSKSDDKTQPRLPSNYDQIIQMLVEARHEQGLSQEKLAHKIGCTESLIHKWEQHKRIPSGFFLMCWLDALGYDVEVKKR